MHSFLCMDNKIRTSNKTPGWNPALYPEQPTPVTTPGLHTAIWRNIPAMCVMFQLGVVRSQRSSKPTCLRSTSQQQQQQRRRRRQVVKSRLATCTTDRWRTRLTVRHVASLTTRAWQPCTSSQTTPTRNSRPPATAHKWRTCTTLTTHIPCPCYVFIQHRVHVSTFPGYFNLWP